MRRVTHCYFWTSPFPRLSCWHFSTGVGREWGWGGSVSLKPLHFIWPLVHMVHYNISGYNTLIIIIRPPLGWEFSPPGILLVFFRNMTCFYCSFMSLAGLWGLRLPSCPSWSWLQMHPSIFCSHPGHQEFQ